MSIQYSNPRRRALVALVAVFLTAGQAAAQLVPDFDNIGRGLQSEPGAEESKVSISSEFTAATDERPAMLFVTAKIADGFHMYAVDQGKLDDGGGPQPTTIKITGPETVRALATFQPIQQPKSHVDNEIWKGLELREHEGEVTWYAPIEFAEGVNPKEVEIEGFVDGQACTAMMCVPLNEISFKSSIGAGIPIPEQPVDEPPPMRMSLAAAAAYGVLGGLILNLMPCVLPVIGLKLFSFAKQGGQSRAHVFGLNLSYAAGLLTIFMILASLAVTVQLGWGGIYTLTWFKVAMTALVFSMALSFLGVWEIPIPGFATSGKATEMAAQEGMFGAFCMGLITTLLAVPCSGPFLGPLFGYTISQPAAVTYVVFAAVGFGMALPYLLIGAFPSLISWLPKPGPWMETLKNFMGFGLLATVVYLFSTISHEYFLPTLSLLFAIWFACWWIGRTPSWAESRVRLNAWATGVAVATLVGFVSFKMMGPSKHELNWQPYSPQSLALARAQGKTVLVDFTAEWCLTCKTNLVLAIDRPEVKQLVEKNDVVALKADWTDKNDMIKQALLELKSRSIPLLAVYPADPNREVIVLPDLLSQSDVLEALKSAGPSIGPSTATATTESGEESAGAPEAPEFGARSAVTTRR